MSEKAHGTGNLTPREVWGPTWTGAAEWIPSSWLARINKRRRYHFRTEMSWITEDLFIMHDTSTFEDGRVDLRDGTALRVADDRIRLTYDGVPSGMDIQLGPHGFESSYQMLWPLAPPLVGLPVLTDVVDDNFVGTAGEARVKGLTGWAGVDASTRVMHDVLSLRWRGRPLGRLEFRLTPEGEGAE